MGTKARIAIVGTGWWATTNHLPVLTKRTDLQVVALCDLNASKAQKAADAFGVDTIYTDLENMLDAEALDAVVVATYHATHYPVAQACLERGLHVFIEKPMTLYAHQAQHLVELADIKGVQIVMGYNHNHKPCTMRARELILGGELGAVQYVAAQFSRPVLPLLSGNDRIREYAVNSPGDVYSDPERSGGGHGQLQMTHLAGMIFFTTEMRIKKVHARMANHNLAVDLVVACTVDFENGALGTVGGTGNVAGGGQSTRLTIFCENGWLDIDDTAATLSARQAGKEIEFVDSHLDSDEARERVFFGPCTNFADVITGKAENLCPGRIGWRAVELLDATYRSAKQAGGVVSIEDLYQKTDL